MSKAHWRWRMPRLTSRAGTGFTMAPRRSTALVLDAREAVTSVPPHHGEISMSRSPHFPPSFLGGLPLLARALAARVRQSARDGSVARDWRRGSPTVPRQSRFAGPAENVTCWKASVGWGASWAQQAAGDSDPHLGQRATLGQEPLWRCGQRMVQLIVAIFRNILFDCVREFDIAGP